MDLMNRGNRPAQENTQNQAAPAGLGARPAAPKASGGKPSRFKDKGRLQGLFYGLFVVGIAVLIAAVLLSVVLTDDKQNPREESLVKPDQHQVVFLNVNGEQQFYFGKIKEINSEYMALDNIYYLRANQQVQPGQTNQNNDVTLVQLGCELHAPEQLMVINRDQILFWENLKNDGTVAKGIEEYKKQNPNGCKDQQARANSSTNTSTNNATNNAANQTNNATTNQTNTNTNTNR